MLKKLLPNFLSIIVILAVVLLAFMVLIDASFTMKWDMMNQFLPCRYFISESLRHHSFPLWCPYINFGYPFFADPQSGVFYPVTWLLSLTLGYNAYIIGLEYVLHVAIAAIAFFYLLKSFNIDIYAAVAFGLVYCLSGVFIGNAQHLPWVVTMAWLPLILLCFKNIFENAGLKNALGLALFLYLGITGGYPGFFIILFYFFVVYAVVKLIVSFKSEPGKNVVTIVLFFVLAVAVLAVLAGGYLVSFLQALPYIARGKPVSLIEANNIPVSPHSLISLLFPFATAASSYQLDTDISMANMYCGLFMLPLVVIAIIKVRLQFFHKAILLFAAICLMAAAGKYFYVRTLLYNLLPGMNMLRHAAIFRVFTVFGLVFIAATGFNWLIAAIRNKSETGILKAMFSGYFVLLAVALVVSYLKGNQSIHFLNIFNREGVEEFNSYQNVYSHISVQLVFQLLLLLFFVALLFLKNVAAQTKTILLSLIIVTDVFVAAQLNLPATVISNVKPAVLQAKLDKLSKDYPVPALSPMESFTHYSDGSTLPIWYNLSFFKKIPAKDGFNSFYLQQVDDLNASAKADSFLKKPVVFFNNPRAQYTIEKFEPNDIMVKCSLNANDTVYLQQNYYKGWIVSIDGQEQQPNHELCSMSAPVATGNHLIRFEFRQNMVVYLFFLSVISTVLIIGSLIGMSFRSRLN